MAVMPSGSHVMGHPEYAQQRSAKQPDVAYTRPTSAYPSYTTTQQQQQQAAYHHHHHHHHPQMAPAAASQLGSAPFNSNSIGAAEYDDVLAMNSAAPLVSTTVGKLPRNNTLKSKMNMPLGGIFQPFAQADVIPLVPSMGIPKLIRCVQCRIYINCFVKFIENGYKWSCNFCGHINDVPGEYYCPIFPSGDRQDKEDRPELRYSTVEFVASPEYMNRPPMAPQYLLLLDVSRASIQSGFAACVCSTLKTILQSGRLPGVDRAKFGIITFARNVHFYNISASKSSPHISVVSGDPRSVFVPLHEGGVLEVQESNEAICHILDSIPTYWANQTSQEVSLAGALTAARTLMKQNGGKILLAVSTLPLAPELGLNPGHDSRKADAKGRLLATRAPDEADGLKSSSMYFSQAASTLTYSQISVDMIIAPQQNASMDLATMNKLCEHTGGSLFYYPGFKPDTWGSKLYADIASRLLSPTGWEGVIRIRPSKSLKLVSYHGNFAFRGVDLMMLPCFTDSHTVAVTFDCAESVVAEQICYLQLALLYTTSSGERRIRVITHALPTTLKLHEIVASADLKAISHVISHKAMGEVLNGKLSDGRQHIQSEYNNVIVALSMTNPMTPPPNDPTIPLDENNLPQQATLLSIGMMKSPAFRDGKDLTPDERVAHWHRLRSAPTEVVMAFYVPSLYHISNLTNEVGMPSADGESIVMPWKLRCTARLLNSNEAYLCCDGQSIWIWLGRTLKSDWLRATFGVSQMQEIDPFTAESILQTIKTPQAVKLNNILGELRRQYSSDYLRVVVCKQGEAIEYKMLSMMIEDKIHAAGLSLTDAWQKYTVGGKSVGAVTSSPPSRGYYYNAAAGVPPTNSGGPPNQPSYYPPYANTSNAPEYATAPGTHPVQRGAGYAAGTQPTGYAAGTQPAGYAAGTQQVGYAAGTQPAGYAAGTQSAGYAAGTQQVGYAPSQQQGGGYSRQPGQYTAPTQQVAQSSSRVYQTAGMQQQQQQQYSGAK